MTQDLLPHRDWNLYEVVGPDRSGGFGVACLDFASARPGWTPVNQHGQDYVFTAMANASLAVLSHGPDEQHLGMGITVVKGRGWL